MPSSESISPVSTPIRKHVPLLDLKAQYGPIRQEIEAAVLEVFESQHFILGPQVEACEKAIAAYSQCPFAVGVSSGSDALLIALMAEKIGSGDEVITTAYSFFATAGAIARVGAKPVFVDIDPATFNLDVRKINQAITEKTKAIIPVHLFGQMADMDPLLALAKEYRLIVIEDAAQAIGAEYKGRRAGSFGDYGCFSFFPSKNLGAAGDGGMVVSQDEERAKRVRLLRNHGSQPKYYHKIIGGNFRLDTLQAAVVSVKLKHLDLWTQQRQQNAERYRDLFSRSGAVEEGLVVLPQAFVSRHIFNQFVIRAKNRDQLRLFLKERGVDTEIYYPLPLHLQECFRDLGWKEGDLPESESAAAETLALPIYPELSNEQAEWVVQLISQFYLTPPDAA